METPTQTALVLAAQEGERRKRDASQPRCPGKSLKHPLTAELRAVTIGCVYT
jgi:hypothetical protein